MKPKAKTEMSPPGIQRYGERMTKPREAILKVFEKSSGVLSADDIYQSVHKTHPGIGLTTVYRNVELLVDQGVLSKFEFGHGKAKYELSESFSPLGHHHHLVCTRCTKVVNYNDFLDAELKYLKTAEEGLAKRFNFKITNHIIQFQGLCGTCRKKH